MEPSLSNIKGKNKRQVKNQVKKPVLDGGVRQFKDAVRYAQLNWKTVLPVVAALGLGAYFLRGRPTENLKKG